MLAYLSRYTHRVAIANSRLIACDRSSVTFRWKDYRAEGRDRQKVMTLSTGEFIRRFLIHVLPQGFHRIRHYGLLASGTRADNIARARELLAVSKPEGQPTAAAVDSGKPTCPCFTTIVGFRVFGPQRPRIQIFGTIKTNFGHAVVVEKF